MDKIPLLNSSPTNQNEFPEMVENNSAFSGLYNPDYPELKPMEDLPFMELRAMNDDDEESLPYSVSSVNIMLMKPQVFRSEVTFDSLVKVVQDLDINKLQMLLLEKKVHFMDGYGLNILHVAMSLGNDAVLKVLLNDPRSRGLINEFDMRGMSLLMYAVRCNKISAAELLCSNGADITVVNNESGDTALHYAVRAEDQTFVEILLKHNSASEFVNYINAKGETALTSAIQIRSPAVHLLLDCGTTNYMQSNPYTGRTILHMAIIYSQMDTLQKILLNSKSTLEFLEMSDSHGDSALMLAVRLGQFKLIEILTQHMPQISGINYKTHETILHIAISKNSSNIVEHLLPYLSEYVIHYTDANGRTPFFLAVELGKINCLNVLLNYGVDVAELNMKNGETILHAVVRTKNISVLHRIMALDGIKYLFSKKDKEGNTPYMSAIKAGNALCLKHFLKVEWTDLSETSQDGDTMMFYAAKHGFLNVLQSMLLSNDYYTFCNTYESKHNISDEQVILDAEIRGEIYASDVYILLGKKIAYELTSWFPTSMFLRSKWNRNIFHACALGGSKDCLQYIYNYFIDFNQKPNGFDETDDKGNTPLLLAVQRGASHLECIIFFLKHHASIIATNSNKINVINAIISYIPQHTELLTKLLDNCIITKKGYDYRQNIGLDFKTLCPKHTNQMEVITTLFQTLEGPKAGKILEHPVLRAFLHLKWKKAGHVFTIRFLLSLISTLILTSYLIFKISEDFQYRFNSYISTVYKIGSFLIFFFGTIGICFSIPQLTLKNVWYIVVVTYSLTLLPSLTSFLLVILSENSPFINELYALAVLTSWFCLIMYSINIFLGMSDQVAMFTGVMFRMLKHFIVFLLILIAFSFSFFCIFNEDKKFSNPFISFIYTTVIVLLGKVEDLPIFTTRHPLKGFKYSEFIVECTIIFLFMLVATIGLLNMLVVVAIRGGRLLKRDGRIFRNQLRIKWLNDLEILYARNWYPFFEKTHLNYLLGVASTRKISRNIDIKYSSLLDKNGKLIIPDDIFYSLKKAVLVKTKNE